MSNGTINMTYNGITIDTARGPVPVPTPKELLTTRAVEAKGGWLGQIVMAGEIVHETEPRETSGDALEEVNKHVHDRFKRLIMGD